MKPCAIANCLGKLTDKRQKYCVIHRYEAIKRNTYAFKKTEEKREDITSKLNRGFARQANLPESAYPANFASLGYYAQKAQEEKSGKVTKIACACHFRKNVMFDPSRYRGCYYCAVENWRCCDQREEYEKKYA